MLDGKEAGANTGQSGDEEQSLQDLLAQNAQSRIIVGKQGNGKLLFSYGKVLADAERAELTLTYIDPAGEFQRLV